MARRSAKTDPRTSGVVTDDGGRPVTDEGGRLVFRNASGELVLDPEGTPPQGEPTATGTDNGPSES